MKSPAAWLLLTLAVAAEPAPLVVKPQVVPPEARFSVRHTSGVSLPGGPDSRALLPSGTEFWATPVQGERGIILHVEHPGYQPYEQAFSLAQGQKYWVEARHGWVIPIELVPDSPISSLRHQFRFHPAVVWLGLGALGFMLGFPLWSYRSRALSDSYRARLRESAAEQIRREAQEMKEKYDPDLVGREIGEYKVLRKLGEGSYAQVFLAQHMSFGDQFALKVIRPYMVDYQTIKRIHRELEIGRNLTHPNLVRIAAFGDYQGAPYLVMDYVDGETLTSRLHRDLDRREALRLFRQICEGVAHAHGQGVIHRDLKPDNIMLTRGGDLKVLDFGVARPTEDRAKLTGTGQAIGTPAYMAPEQLLGNATLRSDVYALGVILFLMLTGRLPFENNDSMDVVSAHLSERAPSLSQFVEDIPPALESLVHAMLEKSASKRIAGVKEVMERLDQITL